MLRLMAFSKDKRHVGKAVLPYTRWSPEDDGFMIPELPELKEFRCIAVTLSTCGKLHNLGLTGHFDHIFMDEGGHSIEPEAIAAFASIATSDPSIVLAGDPKQLGPIVRSDLAKKYGLDKSLLERLSELPAYMRRGASGGGGNNDRYETKLVTKLVQNYRSHPAILKLPNERFYDGDLVASAEEMRMKCLERWEHLPKKGFPCIFHGVEGVDAREGNSPSWFNATEASLVRDYVSEGRREEGGRGEEKWRGEEGGGGFTFVRIVPIVDPESKEVALS